MKPSKIEKLTLESMSKVKMTGQYAGREHDLLLLNKINELCEKVNYLLENHDKK